MEIKNIDIARVALCTEGAVRKAKHDGKMDSLEGVVAFCLAGRLKSVGIGFMDKIGDLMATGDVTTANKLKTGADFETNADEPEYVPDHEHDEENW